MISKKFFIIDSIVFSMRIMYDIFDCFFVFPKLVQIVISMSCIIYGVFRIVGTLVKRKTDYKTGDGTLS